MQIFLDKLKKPRYTNPRYGKPRQPRDACTSDFCNFTNFLLLNNNLFIILVTKLGVIFDPVLLRKQVVFRANQSYCFKACFLPKTNPSINPHIHSKSRRKCDATATVNVSTKQGVNASRNTIPEIWRKRIFLKAV